jgi:hypothetical protein
MENIGRAGLAPNDEQSKGNVRTWNSGRLASLLPSAHESVSYNKNVTLLWVRTPIPSRDPRVV